MTQIVAIGGGEIGRPGHQIETLSIDKEIINLTEKSKPNLLFLPTASGDDPGYASVVKEYYGTNLGCNVDVLYISKRSSLASMQSCVDWADIIYVGGGNTLKMLEEWRVAGLDKILTKAANENKVLAGVSAGAVCWFDTVLSDSMRYTATGEDWTYVEVKGLGLYNLTLCPHFDSEPKRQPALKEMLKETGEVALALENCTAIGIIDNKFRIITSNNNRHAYRAYWKNRKYHTDKLESNAAYRSLDFLTSI